MLVPLILPLGYQDICKEHMLQAQQQVIFTISNRLLMT
jgi:hypothetical protein